MTRRTIGLVLILSLQLSCEGSVLRPPPPEHGGIHSFAHGCYAMDATAPGSEDTRWLEAIDWEDGEETREGYAFTARALEDGARFFMQPSDLGRYIFYDADENYLVGRDGELVRQSEVLSDLLLADDTYLPGIQWDLEVSAHDPERFQLRHVASGQYLTRDGFAESVDEAAVIALYPSEGCATYPELTVDAEGLPARTTFDDGDLYGIVDTHSHIFSNYAFGGGGIFHGAPYHPFGVPHALPNCSIYHGRDGRADLFGYAFDESGDLDTEAFVGTLVTGRTPEPNHATEGWPDFTDWPSAHDSSTHQTQYYRWLERAWLGGLRLVIQHATTNQIICELLAGSGAQPIRYSCNDMVAVDRILEETYAMERYIDAQSGGPGEGFFRIVTTPAEARAVIADGKMAVVLGIETSNLFDCYVNDRDGFERCDESVVMAQLDRYHELGVRVMFPVHKYDNGFSAGDGHKSFIEAGNFINSGHWSNFTQDCPDIPTTFDRGEVSFGGLNMPRDDYDAEPPHDFSSFGDNPIGTLLPFVDQLMSPPLEGDWCMNAGLTPLGESLVADMMRRGMILEMEHFPRRAYLSAYEMAEAAGYPGLAGTHGLNYDGRIYAMGGISKTGLGRCGVAGNPGAMTERLAGRVQLIRDNGGYPAEGFGFDLNGFAGAPGPRFGDGAGCSDPQENPITYPFMSVAGDVTFTEPRVGNRVIDFNTEGFAHIGMLPELLEDARRTGATEEDLEPLFRSAEGYIRMWEAAEARAAEL